MQSRKPIISSTSLARFNTWARLWLMWFVGACAPVFSSRWRARDLDRVAAMVRTLIFLNAAARLPPPQRTRNRHGRLNPATRRVCTGARLRKLMRGRSFVARLFAILSVIRDAERHIARLMRRLRKGLTRLRIIDPLSQSCACISLAAPAPASADSS